MNPFIFGNPTSIGQQTAAAKLITQYAQGNGWGTRGPRRKRKKATRAKSRTVARTRSRKARSKPARLVKGSAAAKAYMAKIRRKRRK